MHQNKSMTRLWLGGVALAVSMGLAAPALAADAESCKTIRLSDPGWTDITATNGVASVLLEALGYPSRQEGSRAGTQTEGAQIILDAFFLR